MPSTAPHESENKQTLQDLTATEPMVQTFPTSARIGAPVVQLYCPALKPSLPPKEEETDVDIDDRELLESVYSEKGNDNGDNLMAPTELVSPFDSIVLPEMSGQEKAALLVYPFDSIVEVGASFDGGDMLSPPADNDSVFAAPVVSATSKETAKREGSPSSRNQKRGGGTSNKSSKSSKFIEVNRACVGGSLSMCSKTLSAPSNSGAQNTKNCDITPLPSQGRSNFVLFLHDHIVPCSSAIVSVWTQQAI